MAHLPDIPRIFHSRLQTISLLSPHIPDRDYAAASRMRDAVATACHYHEPEVP